jgi:hypothetical protein
MASLLERIEQIGADAPQPQQKGIEQVLRQKTGKARRRKGPAASGLQEQQAITAGRQAIKEQTFADRLADVQFRSKEQALAEQQALQEQQAKQQQEIAQQRLSAEAAMTREGIRAGEEEAQIKREASTKSKTKDLNVKAESQLRDMASQRGVQLDNLFAQYQFDTADLEDRQDAAQLEQQAFMLAMQDRKYLEELDRIGKERQLQNDMRFSEELNSIVMEQNLNNLLDNLNFKVGRDVKARDFNEQLGQINIDMAIDIAKASTRDAMERQKWEAIGQLGGMAAESFLGGEE